jgi:hypothetical protein
LQWALLPSFIKPTELHMLALNSLRLLTAILLASCLEAWPGWVRADGPADNQPDNVRRVPELGIAVPATEQAALETKLAELQSLLQTADMELKGKSALSDLLPDVEVFYKAVHDALAYKEFYNLNEIPRAHALLEEGRKRADALRKGVPYWTKATGLVVRGYRSKIDGSVQPYGLVIPASFQVGSPYKHRLDFWLHGRGEKLTELSFISGRMRQVGEFAPAEAFVLHPYGRYCCANKFAGEVDTFEALDHARKFYPIDENRIAVRGFSMGGAACWQYAVHSAGMWAAAAPGAGFSETADFLQVFQKEQIQPTSWERKLWHWYDATDYAVNLYQCPTVAYSGEIDRQKQAADMMAAALAKEGIELTHIIGPKTAHAYQPQAKQEVNRRMDAIMARGRDPLPCKIHFTTWTLRYNEMLWVTIDSLGHHWQRARVDAEIAGPSAVTLKMENVDALTLNMAPGLCPLDMTRKPSVTIDGRMLSAPPVGSDRSWLVHLRKQGREWHVVPSDHTNDLAKRHGLQGPIDDAFMDSFVMVRPSGTAANQAVQGWVEKEMAHAIEHWRRQFRGVARVIGDDQLTEAEIARSNLVLWGDPQSNKVLARIADKLPIQWNAQELRVGAETFAADKHVPLMVYPNPLNPSHYIVLNSGFTFREYDYLNNARQTAKLPDIAVVDVSIPPSSRMPGRVVGAGFFDESWKLPEKLDTK